MEENKWVSGVIKSVNPARQTGVIRKYDGEDVIFSVADIEINPEELREGQKVLYNLEKSNIGALAKKIMILNSE